MSIDRNDILTAVELLDKNDAEQFQDGKPILAAVRRVTGNDKLTQAELDDALAPADAAPAPVAPAARLAEQPSPGADPDERPEGIGPSEDRTAIVLAEVEALKQTKATLMPDLAELQKKRAALDAEIAEKDKAIVAIDVAVEEKTVQISDADMVKRIQKQTQDRLMAQAENAAKVAEQMKVTGIKTFASPLDAALANGAKRSKVILAGGKVFEAPHPRSPEGVKSYANWVHRGQGQPA